MRATFCRLFVALCASGLAATAGAQMSSGSSGGGMSLSSRVTISYQQANVDSAGKRMDWMQFVILWRGQPGWESGRALNETQRAAGRRAYEQARIAAAVADRSFLGGGGAIPFWAELDRTARRLYVLGREFEIPERGSALVVIIDRIDEIGGPPTVVGSAVIDGQLPEEVRSKTWTSGDTTFMVRPSKSGIDAFLETLKQDPVVAAFLSETSPRD
jgi:hypothetical protein